ncbi:hypothetical protein CZ774_08755 [Frigoribacterium sp. JB110]|nr:hypothetical protein CZ774_08755 [Frigoribacterium sp. JB110]
MVSAAPTMAAEITLARTSDVREPAERLYAHGEEDSRIRGEISG